MVMRMQQTHGNRAVQRSIHSHTNASYASLRPVQRDEFTSSSMDEEYMSVAEEAVCYPEEEAISYPSEASDMSGEATGGGSTTAPAVPTAPGPNPTQQEMMQYQMQMQKYKQMIEMMTRVTQMSHETSNSMARNLR
jgi:hypothetical protein